MKRRRFLTALPLAAAGLAVHGRLYAAAPGGPKFLLVFLRGGYDCASALVPYASDYYYACRPTIALRTGGTDEARAAQVLDANWALAPALRADFGALWQAGELAAVPFAGTDDTSRSHFETQDDIELGGAPAAARRYGSGFLARLSAEAGGARPIAFTSALPLAYAGLADVPSVAIRDAARAPLDGRQGGLFRELYAGQPLAAAVNEGLDLRAEVRADLATGLKDPARSARGPGAFAADAPRIGALLRSHFSLGFVDFGGWDTHVNQGGADGALARNLGALGAGVSALKAALGPDWNRTVVVVVSEFGRTFRENGNRGTDHGHGSVYWVLGGGVRGGQVAGRQQRLAPGSLFEDRDYPVLNNYRDLLGGLFARLWSLDARAVERVFPGARPDAFGLV